MEQIGNKEDQAASFSSAEDTKDEYSVKTIRKVGAFRSIGMSLYEQRHHLLAFIIFFSAVLLEVCYGNICGIATCLIPLLEALFPLQAYFYSEVVSAFQYHGSEIVSPGNP